MGSILLLYPGSLDSNVLNVNYYFMVYFVGNVLTSLFQFFVLSDIRRDHATFHEFEVEGTTYTPIGEM